MKPMTHGKLNRAPIDILPYISTYEYVLLDYIMYRSNLPNWELRVDDITKKTGVSRSKVLRLLPTFVARGWLEKRDGHYTFLHDNFAVWAPNSGVQETPDWCPGDTRPGVQETPEPGVQETPYNDHGTKIKKEEYNKLRAAECSEAIAADGATKNKVGNTPTPPQEPGRLRGLEKVAIVTQRLPVRLDQEWQEPENDAKTTNFPRRMESSGIAVPQTSQKKYASAYAYTARLNR